MADIFIGNIKGPQGDTGATGPQGEKGDAATIRVGSVTTTQYGQTARVTNSGTENDAVFDFVIPQGRPGEQVTRMDNLTLDALTEPSAQFPVPAVGDNGSTLFGKISKFCGDIKGAITGLSVSGRTVTYRKADGTTGTITTQDTTYGLASTSADGLLRQLTGNSSHWMRGDGTWQTAQNNLTTTEAGYVLDARMGKTLSDRISHYADVLGVIYSYTPSATMTIPSTGLTNLMHTEQIPVGSYIITAHVEIGSETDSTTLITRLQLYREYDQRALADIHPLTKTATIVFPDYVLNAGRYFIRISANKSADATGDGVRNYLRLMRIK